MQVAVDTVVQVARVAAVPLPPFLSIRDGSLDAVSLSRLASFIRRGAYKCGWLHALNPTFQSNTTGVANASVKEGTLHTTVFMVGQLVVLEKLCPYSTLPLDAHCSGRCFLTSVGRTSYGVATEITAPTPDGSESHRVGFAAHSFVTIDTANRRPTSLDEGARTEAERALAVEATDEVKALRSASRFARLAHSMRPDTDTPHFLFANRVRPHSDFDFNGHMNQGVYVSLALDAIFAFGVYAKEDVGHQAAWLRDFLTGTDVHVRAIRVDYLREVSDPQAVLTVGIWDARSTSAVSSLNFVEQCKTLDRADNATTVPIWFEVSSETPSASDSVVNAIGVLVVTGPAPAQSN